jgi:hypothetical protein
VRAIQPLPSLRIKSAYSTPPHSRQRTPTPLITQRAAEKIRLDYNGVAARVKDYLRATFVVTTMHEVCLLWGAVEELKAQGQLEVMSIKNRFR